jgi:glycolate oxidase iron-sulfur subunit
MGTPLNPTTTSSLAGEDRDHDRRGAAVAFDDRHPPAPELLDDCVRCGFCLPTCPTYVLWREEMDSPRGRIHLMKLGVEGEAQMTDSFVGHFDACLGCMACETACPSGVQYGKLLEATRSQIERNHRRPRAERWFRELLFGLFPHPPRLRAALIPLWLYQRSGTQRILQTIGLARLLPANLSALESLLPPVSLRGLRDRLPEIVPSEGPRRRRVGMLLGCVQRVFFDEVNAATVRVLAAEGCEVVIPRVQGCCGALLLHSGEDDRARDLARRTIDAFEAADVEAVVINAAGCGSTMKEYGELLHGDPAYAERAAAFASRCLDVSEVLDGLEPRAPRHPLKLRVAYHDACHLQHAQRVHVEPRRVIRQIPGVELVEIPESALCCGSAGIYNLTQPAAAAELGRRKVENLLTTRPDVVVSANPGCLLQIGKGLQLAGRPLPVFHLVQLLDASIRGTEVAPGVGLGRARRER